MARFVFLHLLHDGLRGRVGRRQLFQMRMQVLFNLTFGLDHEAQAHRIASTRRQQPERERAGVPERVQQARVRVEFPQPLLGPRKVIGLLARGVRELSSQCWVARSERLGAVQRLRAHLADMIDTHQRARQATLFVVERGAGNMRHRACARRVAGTRERAKGDIGGTENGVERGQGGAVGNGLGKRIAQTPTSGVGGGGLHRPEPV